MQFEPGASIGKRFKVIRKLGQGGIGIVYLVEDLERKTQVALKILKPEIASNPLAMERFKREVSAMRQIDHPGIVQVFDTGRIGDSLFFTMEYVSGQSVSELIRKKGPMPVNEALSLAKRICGIMDAVHRVMVHRDLSSDNFMIDDAGEVHLLDFGTARLIQEESKLTQAGLHLGKICYSAPEQRIDSKTVDHRADLYSMAVLLYEMLTGELVVCYEPVTDYREELPEKFNPFFEKAMAQEPDDRFASAAQFGEELSQFD